VFLRQRVAVFIDGCFWHGCPEHYVRPRTQEKFWCDKLRANFERDRRQTRALLDQGWHVLRFWEHEAQNDCTTVCDSIAAALRGDTALRTHRRIVSVILIDQLADLERRNIEDLLDVKVSEMTDGPRMSRAGGPARRRRKV
jgi:DNA mismatch endonuclease (patch repair protein)